MKPLNIHEIRTFAQNLTDVLKGGQLQEVLSNDRGLALGFYQTKMHWLLIDLIQVSPLVLLFEDSAPFQKAKKPKPVALFLNSHAENLFFESAEVLEQWGRVLLLKLSKGEKHCEIEIQLIPKQMNLLVRCAGKSISWEKPRELKPAIEVPELEERSLRQIQNEWLQEQKSPQKGIQDPAAQWEQQRQKDIQKKTKALGEIEKQFAEDKSLSLQAAGEHLKTHGFSEVEADWEKLLDRKKSVSWNIENLFHKAKQFEQKKSGAAERLRQLKEEIRNLQQARYQPKKNRSSLDDLMSKTEARGRKLHLENGAVAYCGRSAADNLSLLRQAKAWDYWLHLKDYPGAHAIIHRQREQNISEAEVSQVTAWLAKESLSAKTLMVGQRLAVVMVECRFVKPIKGDKLGRVTYHSEKTFQLNYK